VDRWAQVGAVGGQGVARQAALGPFGFELAPQRRVGLRQLGQAVEQGLEVEHGATCEDGQAAPGMNGLDQVQGRLAEGGGGPGLAGFEDVDEMMGNAAPFLGRGLGGADVHAAIDQGGIDADDLTTEPFGQTHGQLRLAGGRGAEQGQDRKGCVHWPRRNRRSRLAMSISASPSTISWAR